ncbi:unnamed protein product [Zymoseptoria tritici ST99CH_1A5]|uniref:Uncharacterized protein n=1 Tax=Zymoseptoria tritici ST99CH_1A5 TaxID=1276529 RepID=A0A1Y6M301_ZYMTR|nr:unnamed protein product [Zymoseptoria tritici ST99CH_1A5]
MVTQAIMARALTTTGEHARERLPSTPSAAAQSSQLPASTTLASAPRPRRSRASPTSRTSTLKSQLESLTSLFTALEEQPAGYAEGAAIEIVAVQCHLSTSSTGASHRVTDYSSTAICRARSNLTDHHAAGHLTGIFAVHFSERRLNGTSRSASAHSAFSTTHQIPSSFKHSPSE